jgi:hypothetical protein
MFLGSQIIGYNIDGRMNGDDELEKIWKENAATALTYYNYIYPRWTEANHTNTR